MSNVKYEYKEYTVHQRVPVACTIHGKRYWIESIPKGAGYCQQCAKNDNRNDKLGNYT